MGKTNAATETTFAAGCDDQRVTGSMRTASGQGQLFGDDDTADHSPRCESTGSNADLHLAVHATAGVAVARVPQSALDLGPAADELALPS